MRSIVQIVVLCLGVLFAAGADAQWRVFTPAEGLVDGRVTLLLEDRRGNVWVGTDKGLSQYNKFFTTHLSGLAITALLESTDGRIWVGTNQGLYVYDGTSWDAPIVLMGMPITALLESTDGRIWTGTTRGLYIYDGTRWNVPEALRGMPISVLRQSTDSTIWAGTLGNGLLAYDGTRWSAPEALRGMQISVLLQSTDSTIWAGTFSDGLQVYDGIRWAAPAALNGMRMTALLESTEGMIWAGTFTNGLQVYNGTRWSSIPELKEVAIFSLLQSADGTIWAGTVRHGLWTYDGTRWKTQKALEGLGVPVLIESTDKTIWAGTGQGLYIYNSALERWMAPGELKGMMVFSLLERQGGVIWAGTDKGLWVYDGTRWNGPEALKGLKVYSLLELTDGVIWAGTILGLWVYNGTNWGSTPALSGQSVFSLLQSTDGRIWAGTLTDGLWVYDGTNWRPTLVRRVWVTDLLQSTNGAIWAGTTAPIISPGLLAYDGTTWRPTPALEGMEIFALLESTDGRIWAGTGRNGLLVYDGTKWDIRTDFIKGRLIRALFQSKNERVWAGTNKGLQVYDGTRWETLTVLDGLPHDFILSILEDRHGKLWVGTEGGIGVYQPNDNPPSVQIKKIAGQSIESPYRTGISAISIEWFAIDRETDTQRLTYQYKIDAGAWVETSANFIMTPALDDGEHTFFVRAIDRDFNTSEPATLTISVDTFRPVVLITTPAPDAIVGRIVQVIGGVTDTDFAEFQVDYAEGADSSEGDFKLIGKSSRPVESGLLAEWDTKSLGETQYTIQVRAIDTLGHTREDTVTVLLDHTPPIAELTAPQDGARLTEHTQIRGKGSDLHLDGYVLEYTADPDPKAALWRQIFQKTGLLQAQQTQVDIQHEWQVPTATGSLFLRLTAFDAAGNSGVQMVAVEVPQTVTRDKGGTSSSSNGVVSLTIPPRSLPADTVVTINPVPAAEIQPPPDQARSLALAYDIGPEDLELSSLKPATLQIKLNAPLAQSDKQIASFRWQPATGKWNFLGGTLQADKVTVGITKFGRYALMEVEGSPELSGGDSLFTCQPRVFSPKQGTATISFYVPKVSSVTLRVYDLDGRLQRTLVSGETMGIGSQAVVWDGKDENGRILPSGPYLIALSIGNGNVKTKSVVIQNR